MTITLKKSLLLLLICLVSACESFLDEKPDKKLVVPTSLADLQALLDYYPDISNTDPGDGEISSDDYFLTNADWTALTSEDYRRTYVWEKDRLFETYPNSWSYAYETIHAANTVLEQIERVPLSSFNKHEWENVKGQALFIRARMFLQVALIWSKAYDAATAATDLGIPLRQGTDFNTVSTRASVQQTYERVLADLKAATKLLPEKPLHVIRPSKPAAYALLARTYLAMQDYNKVEAYADSALRLHSVLLDFNNLKPTASYPIPAFNKEIITRSIIPVPAPLNNSRARIAPELYASYAVDDLRKVIFFKSNPDGTHSFKGSYDGGGNLFSGIATDEVLLMRAEAYARQGKTAEAMADLNTLLVNRWKAGTFVPYAASSPGEALALVLAERRKELLMRGLRWMDIKRLNKEGAEITLSRILDGQTYTLPPNDPRFALPLPEEVLALSGMPQNPR